MPLHSRLLIPLAVAGYVATSLITFAMYGLDKRRASRGGGRRGRGRWRGRVPERTLHLLALLGGWPGALLAQQWFKHKRRKGGFVGMTCLIAAAHVAAWALIWRLIG